MTPKTYAVALETAKNELIGAVGELGEAQARTLELEQRIADLRQTISVLSKLCGEADLDLETSLGLTDAIRVAFARIGQTPVTVQEMRLHLESVGFNTRRYGNLLASIHTVFSRLVARGEIRPSGQKSIGNEDSKPTYISTDKLAMVAIGKAIKDVVEAVTAVANRK